jgi:hypothetical protein
VGKAASHLSVFQQAVLILCTLPHNFPLDSAFCNDATIVLEHDINTAELAFHNGCASVFVIQYRACER